MTGSDLVHSAVTPTVDTGKCSDAEEVEDLLGVRIGDEFMFGEDCEESQLGLVTTIQDGHMGLVRFSGSTEARTRYEYKGQRCVLSLDRLKSRLVDHVTESNSKKYSYGGIPDLQIRSQKLDLFVSPVNDMCNATDLNQAKGKKDDTVHLFSEQEFRNGSLHLIVCGLAATTRRGMMVYLMLETKSGPCEF